MLETKESQKALPTTFYRRLKCGELSVNTSLMLRRFLNSPSRVGNIALFTAGRCGGTLLGHLLNQHPAVNWGGEVFHRASKKYRHYSCFTHSPLRILKLKMYSHRCQYFGFETKALSSLQLRKSELNMDLSDYINGLSGIGFNRFFILKRENYLRRVACATLSRQTGIWDLTTKKKVPFKAVKINVNEYRYGSMTASLINHFKYLDNYYKTLDELLDSSNVMHLSYEKDLELDPLSGFEKVCDYLGICPIKVSVNFQKTDPFSLRELISNYGEVEAMLKGSEYEWML